MNGGKLMSSSRASVSQFDSLMEGIISSSDLLASAAASVTDTPTAVDATAFKVRHESAFEDTERKYL